MPSQAEPAGRAPLTGACSQRHQNVLASCTPLILSIDEIAVPSALTVLTLLKAVPQALANVTMRTKRPNIRVIRTAAGDGSRLFMLRRGGTSPRFTATIAKESLSPIQKGSKIKTFEESDLKHSQTECAVACTWCTLAAGLKGFALGINVVQRGGR